MRGRRAGFTFVDLVLVLALGAIALRVALPRLLERSAQAEAERVNELVDRVADAARSFRQLEGRWPDESGPGLAPPGLVEMLGPDVELQASNYRLRWVRWPAPDGSREPLVGVALHTRDVELAERVAGMRGGAAIRGGLSWIFPVPP